jgi:hypothetical protein
VGENARRVFIAILVIVLVIVGLVWFAPGEVSTWVREIARKATQDVASNSVPAWKVWGEGWQAWLTAVGVVIAGAWAFYIFFLGRSYIGVVSVLIEPKGLMTSGGKTGAVVSVTIKNVGRTRVGKVVARMRAAPLTKDQLELSMGNPSMMPASVPITNAELGTLLFSKHATELGEAVDALEPEQETSEEVVIILGDAQVARVEAVFIGRIRPLFRRIDRAFSSRIYLDMAALEAKEANGTPEVSSRSEKAETENRGRREKEK